MARCDYRYAFVISLVMGAQMVGGSAAYKSISPPVLLIRQSSNDTYNGVLADASDAKSKSPLSIAAIIVPIVVLLILFLTAIAVIQRKRLRRVPTQTDVERALRDTPSLRERCVSAVQRMMPPFGSRSASGGADRTETIRPATVVPTDPAEVRAERRRIRRERRNRLRRTDSGHSIRSVPEYKVDAGEDELVLFKTSHGNASSAFDDLSRVETNISSRTDLYSLQDRSLDGGRAADGMYWHAAHRPLGVAIAQNSPGLTDDISASRVSLLPNGSSWNQAGSTPSQASSVMQAANEDSMRGPAPRYTTVDVPTVVIDDGNARASIETVPDVEHASAPATSRHRPSSWRGMFSSTPPRTSALHAHRRGVSANDIPSAGGISGEASPSFPPLSRSFSLARGARTLIGSNRNSGAIAQLTPPRPRPTISSPLTNTLVRSNYELPRAGLSELQMTFLGSVENLGRYGISGDGTLPPPFEASVIPAVEEADDDFASPSLVRPPPLLTRSEAVQRDMDSTSLRPLPNLEAILASREDDAVTNFANDSEAGPSN